ncbi:putative toxin-antitoxin system toxin component, PIN family [Paenibacillus sp. T2-29]|uniref:putative toxin-antitoxin system toxin component, PIN family n=1 Tax=Paenibacillus TaxID=44249 RepID=UPI0039BD78AC
MSGCTAVVDTNVFVHALFYEDENCLKIMDMVENNELNLLFSRDTIGELMYILKNFSRHNLDENEGIELLQNIAELFYTSKSYNDSKISPNTLPKDPDDIMFLKCAIKGNADYLITNDLKSGLIKLTEYDFIGITAKDFIEGFGEDIQEDEVS